MECASIGPNLPHSSTGSCASSALAFYHKLTVDELIPTVHRSAAWGRWVTISGLLMKVSVADQEVILNHKSSEQDGQVTPPLVVAARNGHLSVVKFLVDNYSVLDVEATGKVKHGPYNIQGATALWCAANKGHLGIVQYLVGSAGAQVNNPSETNSTPLRAACFNGNIEVVRYLLDHGADLARSNRYHNTCLMIACYKGHNEIVKLLLEKGADPHATSRDKTTAMHFCAESGNLEACKLLLEQGASLTAQNEYGIQPILMGAASREESIVEFMSTHPSISLELLIDATELLGAAFGTNDPADYRKAYECLRHGMVSRLDSGLRKTVATPIPEYSFHSEAQSLEALESIENVPHLIELESVLVIERVLGLRNPVVIQPIVYLGASYADSLEFDKCIGFWIRAMGLKQEAARAINQDLLRFVHLFLQMIHQGYALQLHKVIQVLRSALAQLRSYSSSLLSSPPLEPRVADQVSVQLEATLLSFLHLCCIPLHLKREEGEEDELKKIIYMAVSLDFRNARGNTLLHSASDYRTHLEGLNDTTGVCYFPSPQLVEVLIECGAEVNTRNNLLQTPLHIIGLHNKPMADWLKLHRIINLLIDAGVHLDVVDSERRRAQDSCFTGVAEIMMRGRGGGVPPLECLVARAVRERGLETIFLPYLPLHLRDFLMLH